MKSCYDCNEIQVYNPKEICAACQIVKLKDVIREGLIAIIIIANNDCGCEPETEIEPSFVCGYHRLEDKFKEALE